MRKVTGQVVLIVALLSWSAAAAQDPQPAAPLDDRAIPVLAEVLVTGEQSGPGLWKISRDGHTLWVLASLSPLPSRMRWETGQVEARIREAGVVIAPPTVKFEIEGGRLRALFLLPRLLGARKNPDGAMLADIVPPPQYRQWQALKHRYLPRNRAVERWRPLFAAQKLYEAAVDDIGLRLSPMVWPTVRKIARASDVPIVRPTAEFHIEDPGDKLASFRRSPLDDVTCFAMTLDRLDADLAHMRERANAWAVGDIDALTTLSTVDPTRTCIESVINSAVMSESGLDAIPARVRDAWRAAAEKALAEHAHSFAVLPLSIVLDDEGPLGDLRDRGYLIEAPE